MRKKNKCQFRAMYSICVVCVQRTRVHANTWNWQKLFQIRCVPIGSKLKMSKLIMMNARQKYVFEVGPEPEVNYSDTCSPDVRFRSNEIIFLRRNCRTVRYGDVVKTERKTSRIKYKTHIPCTCFIRPGRNNQHAFQSKKLRRLSQHCLRVNAYIKIIKFTLL